MIRRAPQSFLITGFIGLVLVVCRPTPVGAENMVVTVEPHVAALGLINLNGQFTEAPLAFGGSAAFEYRVHRVIYIGFETTLNWVKSEQAERFRLLINPQLRVRFSFEVAERLTMYLLLTGGMSIWPADDSEAELEPALGATRLGWSFKTMAGVEYAVNDLASLFLGVGYSMSATYGDDLESVIDGMVISLGTRFRF